MKRFLKRAAIALLLALSTPAVADAPEAVLQTGHEQYVSALAISPGGKTVASGDYSGVVKIWTRPENALLFSWQQSAARINDLHFSPDGKKLLIESEGGLALRETASGEELWRKTSGNYNEIAWTPDGARLVLYQLWDTGTRVVWDAETGNEIGRTSFGGTFSRLQHETLSPDNRVLVSDGTPRTTGFEKTPPPPRGLLVDAVSGKVLRPLAGMIQYVRAQAFSPDGNIVAVGGYDAAAINNSEFWVQLFDVASGKKLRQWPVYNGANASLEKIVFSPDGKTIATSGHDVVKYDQQSALKVWDAQSGKLLAEKRGKSVRRASPRFAPDGKTLVSSLMENRDFFIEDWNPKTGAATRSARGSGEVVGAPGFSPDGRFLVLPSGSRWNSWEKPATLRFFDLQRNDWKTPPWGVGKMVTTKATTINGQAATQILFGAGANLDRWVFSRDGKILVVGKTLGAWNWPEGTLRADAFKDRFAALRAQGFSGTIQNLDIAPDNRTVAVATENSSAPFASSHPAPPGGCLALWDIETGKMEVLRARVDVSRVAFSPDGKKLAAFVTALQNDPRQNADAEIPNWSRDWQKMKTSGALEIWDVAARRLLKSHDAPENFAWLDNERLIGTPPNRSPRDDEFHSPTLWGVQGAPQPFAPAENLAPGVLIALDSHFIGLAREEKVTWLALPAGRAIGRTPILKPFYQSKFSIAPDARYAVVSRGASALEFWGLKEESKLATLALLPPGAPDALPAWIVCTPDGFFDGSPGAEKWIRFRQGGKLLPASFNPSRRQPQLLKSTLGGA